MSGNTQPTQDGGAQPTNTGTPAPTQDKPSAAEQRINQLVGQFHEVKGQLETITGMNQQLMERNAQMEQELARVRAQPSAELPPLPEGADEGLVRAIVARVETPLKQHISRLEQTLQQSIGSTAATTELLAIQQAIAAEVPAVQQRTMELYKEAKQRGLQGWTPQNLMWMAKGQLGVAAQTQAPTAPQFMPGGGVPSPVTPPQPPAKTDAELRAMKPDERLAYLESRVGDAEIMY